MPPYRIRNPPSIEDFTPLQQYQEATPVLFSDDAKPVLYYHTTGAKAWQPNSQRGQLAFLPADCDDEITSPIEVTPLNGVAEQNVEQVVDLFVNSRDLIVYCPAAEVGLVIPYPTIALHAIKNVAPDCPGLYLQLDLSDGGSADETFDAVELTIIPPITSAPTISDAITPINLDEPPPALSQASETKRLFEAMSECSNLHSDPVDLSDEDEKQANAIVFEGDIGSWGEGLPPASPGSGGWITADNAHEFLNSDAAPLESGLAPPVPGSGGWIRTENAHEYTRLYRGRNDAEPAPLGDGAGTVHARSKADGVDLNGDKYTVEESESGDNKRQRTDTS